jgi:hypothetical protein
LQANLDNLILTAYNAINKKPHLSLKTSSAVKKCGLTQSAV